MRPPALAPTFRTAYRRDRPPRAAARRTARRGTVVAAGRHPGTAHPRRRQHRAAPGLDTRTAPPARLAHRRNRHRRPGVAIAGRRRRRLGMGATRPAHRRRRTPARHRRNRAPAARRIRPPADLPRRTAHPPRRHHRRRHPPPRRGRRAVRPRRARRAARPVQRRRSAARPSTTTPTATPKTPSTGWTSPTCPVTARAPRPGGRRRHCPAARPARAAHQHAAHLAQAILRFQGPAEVAAAGELAELHERHQQQRHHQHDLAHAHGDWVSAEHTAEIHRALLDQLATQISAAHDAGDADLAATYLTYRDELTQHTTDIDSAVTRTRQTLDAARTALIHIAGGPERIVTERDIDDVRSAPNAPTSTPWPRPAPTPTTSTAS